MIQSSNVSANSPPRLRPAPGFTIIELLVVIAIISVLVTLLLPSLSTAKGAALHVRCSSQLRQHGIAMNTYLTDQKGYYPSFGGAVVNDYSTWYRTGGSACGQLFQINYNTGSLAYFSDYLGAVASNGNLVGNATNPINYCPSIDWIHWQYYIFTSGTYQFTYFTKPLPNSSTVSFAGYNFYPGNKFWAAGYGSDWDTRPRREDGREILATDLVLKIQGVANTGPGVFPGGQPSMSTVNVPWFNPHAGNSNTVNAADAFHQLTANGAVQSYATSESTRAMTFGQGSVLANYVYGAKTANGFTGDSALEDGPYFRAP